MTTEMKSELASPASVVAPGPMFNVHEKYLTKPQVAELLNVTPRTIDNFMKRGWLVYHKIGRTVRFRMGDIERHLNEKTRVCR